ncbi:Lrp/AsnC family transcriptional regulator [candidate division KSB1 bacterium]|nr:Lrp/AsnC family transcriptional regulator [candidate division KSB1 bacterium]
MPNVKLDATDKKILEILQENGRITNAQLANLVGLSPPPMLERVKKLEKSGVIKKYVAILDPVKVDKSTTVIVSLSLARHRIKSLDQVNKEIMNFPEVLECYHIAGEEDYLLKVVVKDVREYEEFILKKLAQIPAIGKIKSYVVLSALKSDTKIHVE